MTEQSLELNHLLLSLLVQQTGSRGKVASQSVLDRQSILTMAAQHRLEPLLHWRLTEDAGEQRLAEEFTERLAIGSTRLVPCNFSTPWCRPSAHFTMRRFQRCS
jgi:hypothetical protein